MECPQALPVDEYTPLQAFSGGCGVCNAVGWPSEMFVSTLLSTAFWAAVYQISQIVSPLLWVTYRRASSKTQLEWNSRLVSNVHALVIAYIYTQTLSASDCYYSSPYPSGPSLLNTTSIQAFSFGYFLYDFLLIAFNWSALGAADMLLHHFVGLLSNAAIIYWDCGTVYYLMAGISEITTPFVNQRWFFLQSDMRTSPAWTINGVAIWALWMYARLPMAYWYFYFIYRDWIVFSYMPVVPQIIFYFCAIGISTLNVYWWYLITMGVYRAITGQRSSTKTGPAFVSGSTPNTPTGSGSPIESPRIASSGGSRAAAMAAETLAKSLETELTIRRRTRSSTKESS